MKYFNDKEHYERFKVLSMLNPQICNFKDYFIPTYILSAMEKTYRFGVDVIRKDGIHFHLSDDWGFSSGERIMINFACNIFKRNGDVIPNENITSLLELDKDDQSVIFNSFNILTQNKITIESVIQSGKEL